MAGSPHNAYFAGLQNALRTAGLAWPCIIVDRDRLKRNAARLNDLISSRMNLRLVEKSLPVPELLDTVLPLVNSQSLMVFHEPQLRQVTARFPTLDLLIGKPLPVLAAKHFYTHRPESAFNPERQLQWLVDTPQRLAEYAALADALNIKMRVNIEVDVGLHRGGVATPDQLETLLTQLDAHPQLECSGLMGYDAHVGKLPGLVESRHKSFKLAVADYRRFQAVVLAHYPQRQADSFCWNGAGSPTIALHKDDSPLNDIATGSALLKPREFDIDLLADFEPAVFIATPVLKAFDGTRLPGPAWLSRLLYTGRTQRARSYFVYGGGWPAEPCSPDGIVNNAQFGLSFNQSILNGPTQPALQVNDTVFLRPYQSEGSLLHYGPVRVVENGHITDEWVPFNEG